MSCDNLNWVDVDQDMDLCF